ncbi:MAG: methyltransferase family protein [Allosphingosinicella sp.]
MLKLIHGQPVGLPGLVALVLGGALFFASLVRHSLRTSGEDKASGWRSGLSRLGIAIQSAGFAATGFGAIRPVLAPGSAAALLEGALVALLMAGAVGLFTAASRTMGANWSLAARVREDHQLCTQGVFGRLRHPIYTGMGLFLAGLAIGVGHEANLVVGLPLFLIGTAIRVREEERLLRDRFGGAYDSYAARVPRFLPGLL